MGPLAGNKSHKELWLQTVEKRVYTPACQRELYTREQEVILLSIGSDFSRNFWDGLFALHMPYVI